MIERKRKKRKLHFLRLLIVLTAVFMIIGGGFAFGYTVYSLRDIPTFDPESLTPSNATLIYDKNGEQITAIGLEKRIPVKIQDVPAVVKKAFLAAEDNRFYQHHGIDLRAVVRAVVADLRHGNLTQGGSTITQQLAKNCFLSSEKKLKRKIQEVFLAIQIERHYTKDEIFEMYLNQIYFGEGAYGVEMASRTYFGKPVSALTLPEAALLAGLPQAPSAYSPYKNMDAATARRNTVLDLMVKYGYITATEAAAAKEKPIELSKSADQDRPEYPYPYFIDYVTDQLVERYGDTRVFKEGLRVYTTLDPAIQQAAEAAVAKPSNFPATEKDHKGVLQPQTAVVVLDPHTGYIKAIVGGREHKQIRGWNRATRPPGRQPGSSIKPVIAYGPGIELASMGPATVIDDYPIEYPGKPGYKPKNYDGQYRGMVTMRTAVALSINTVAVQVLDRVGAYRAAEFARKLGITSVNPDREGLSMALGASLVTPLQMAGAYGAFANQGVYVEPTAITLVKDAHGNVLDQFQPRKERVMRATTAYLITDMLRTAVQSGTGKRAALGARPVAGKTGTTDDRDNNWFCGYTPELVCTVWMGYDNDNVSRPRSLPPGSFGGTYTAQIWKDVMSQALKGTPIRDFQRPGNLVTASVDSKSGLLPGPNTPPEHIVTDLFVRGTVPTEEDNSHVLAEICPASGLLATEYCPERVARVLFKTGYEVPPIVQDYAERLPTKTCDIHGPGSVLQPLPPGDQPSGILPPIEEVGPPLRPEDTDNGTPKPNQNNNW
ncbi:transglycosylase domain-containing protein [Desulforudis sp. 1031]|uniref:transglycosylase domain-containing protein n=1 Tax=unclassified Candidatus Desulforudis TaxID=2635950 RepID=UPI003CE52B41